MKKAVFLILLCFTPGVANAALKPIFYQGSVISVDKDGFSMTDTHNQKHDFTVKPPAQVFDRVGNPIGLAGLHPHEYVKVLFRIQDPADAVAVYRILCLTKQEKEAYAKAHLQQAGVVSQTAVQPASAGK